MLTLSFLVFVFVFKFKTRQPTAFLPTVFWTLEGAPIAGLLKLKLIVDPRVWLSLACMAVKVKVNVNQRMEI